MMDSYSFTERMIRMLIAMYHADANRLHVDAGNVYTLKQHLANGMRPETAALWHRDIDDLISLGLVIRDGPGTVQLTKSGVDVSTQVISETSN